VQTLVQLLPSHSLVLVAFVNQFNSTMSDYAHRIMQEIREEDLWILAQDAYEKEEAMREGMDEPSTPKETNEQHKPF
jgi:hypothetical protein